MTILTLCCRNGQTEHQIDRSDTIKRYTKLVAVPGLPTRELRPARSSGGHRDLSLYDDA